MKTYELFVHGKQGDDLSSLLDKHPSVSAALDAWSSHFSECADKCRTLSNYFQTAKVSIDADNWMILITPEDDVAQRVCDGLVETGVLAVFDSCDDTDED